MKTVLLIVGALAGVAALGWQSPNISKIVSPPIRISGLEAHDESAAGSLLGQFRTNISAWLWVHADLYLHNGVNMRPITDGEVKNGVTVEQAASDGQEKLEEEKSITVVPSSERDFRGVFGDVERSVSSWKDMHEHVHNDPEQCLPLYRLMTWFDPQFIEGWTTGSMVFARDHSPGGTNRALEFLREGLAANPDSVDLMTEIAYIFITRRQDYQAAVPWLEQARSTGFRYRESLVESEVEAFENTYRWLALCYRDLNQPDEVRRVASQGLKVFPDDRVLARLLAHPEMNGASADAIAKALRE